MVSDDERREAAERLRGLRRDKNNVTQFNHGPTWSLAWCVLGDELDECGTGDWFERMCARLADLIDPDCDEGRYEGVHTARPVDRDALLALADGLEADADRIVKAARNAQFGCGPRMEEAKHDACEWRSIAHRIREACGEVVA